MIKSESIDKYLTFYAQEYFVDANENSLNFEEELLKKLELMSNYKINGVHIIKLILLFKDNLISFKNKNDNNFDFKLYAEKLIEKFVILNEMDPNSLNELLFKLGLNMKDFKIKILSEKVTFLENKIEELKTDYNQNLNNQKQE